MRKIKVGDTVRIHIGKHKPYDGAVGFVRSVTNWAVTIRYLREDDGRWNTAWDSSENTGCFWFNECKAAESS